MANTRFAADRYDGPADTFQPDLAELGDGVWLTSGRTVVIETEKELLLIDPGDERFFEGDSPAGPLAEILELCDRTGKNVGAVLITHAHPDHVTNLLPLLAYGQKDGRIGKPSVLASPLSPLTGIVPVAGSGKIGALSGLLALPMRGHSPWGDDLAFYHPASKILFPGDMIQPKGETWEAAFYPSPWPWFTDGGVYLESLESLLALDFTTLVTGHREVRFAPHGRRWVELTRRAISRVGEEVRGWSGADDPAQAGRAIFKKLAAERGIDPGVVEKRLSPLGESVFDRYDLPGVLYFWNRR